MIASEIISPLSELSIELSSRMNQPYYITNGVGFNAFQINVIHAMDTDYSLLIKKSSRMCGATTIIALLAALTAIDSLSNVCVASVNQSLSMRVKFLCCDFLSQLGYLTSADGSYSVSLDSNGSTLHFCSPGLGRGNPVNSVISTLFIDELCYYHPTHFMYFLPQILRSCKVVCISDPMDVPRYCENLTPVVRKPIIIL